jgi:hypothetical protein
LQKSRRPPERWSPNLLLPADGAAFVKAAQACDRF